MASLLHRALVVTAADYNGTEFDGAPVRTLFPKDDTQTIDEVCPWFMEALEKKKLLIEARGHTDYAWFGVKTDGNNIYWAGPGDVILYNVPHGTLTMVPACVVKYMEREFKALMQPPGLGRNIQLEANAMQFHGEYRPLPMGD